MTKYACYGFDFGRLEIGYDDTVVVSLNQVERERAAHEPTALTDEAARQLREYFAGTRRNFDFAWELRGTPFQKAVWQALRQIPYGQTRTYRQIAEAVGNPKATRAVGMANHRNPLMIVVPCHRVVGADGSLTGYAGGLAMKQALLELERDHATQEEGAV